MPRITVTPAAEHEAAACLALLPEVQGLPAELLIARRDGALAGAAALVWQSWSKPAGFPLSVHVLPDARRQGVGRALVAEAAALAGAETDGLWSRGPVAVEGEAARFMRACGFAPLKRQHHFQARIETLLEHVTPVLGRLRSRGRLPADARVIGLTEAPLEEVGWLVSAEFGGGPESALRWLSRRTVAGAERSLERSLAVMQGDQVAGVVLWRVDDGVAVVEARLVAPGWRGDWPSLLQLEAGLLAGRDAGLTEFRFDCEDTVRDTMNLARRSGGQEMARTATYYFEIPA